LNQLKEGLSVDQAFWQTAIEIGGDGVWDWNVETGEVVFSVRWKEMLGYGEDEILSNLDEWSSRVHPDDLRNVIDEIDRHLRGETSLCRSQYRLRCKDGSYKWMLDRGKVVTRTDDGRPSKMVRAQRDITEHKQTEEALLRSEGRYKTAIENSRDGVFIVRNGKILFCNGRMAEMFGLDCADDFLQAEPYFFIHPDDVARIKQISEDRRVGRQAPDRYDFKGIRKDGGVLALEASVSKILFSDMPSTLVYVRDVSDRKQAEEELKKSQEQYRRIVETTCEGICVLDETWRITLVNKQMEAMFGSEQHEMIGADFGLFGFDEGSTARRKRREQGISEQFERRYRRKDGTTLWVHLSATPIMDDDNRFMGAFAMFTDITARKAAEEALKTSQEQYRRIVETTSEGIIVLEENFTVSFANERMAAMLACELEDLIGKRIDPFIFDEDIPELEEKRKRRRRGIAEQFERRHRRKDGATLWVHLSATPIMDENDRFRGSFAMFTDITARKAAEEALRKSQEQYRRIVETANEGISVLDENFTISFVNRRMAELLGYEPADLIGKKIDDFVFADDIPDFLERRGRRLQGVSEQYERRYRRRDGSILWTLNSITAMMDKKGKFLGCFGMHTDITERKIAEKAVQESEAKYRNIFENAIEGIFQVLPGGPFVTVNPALAKMYGYETPEEFISNVTSLEEQIYPNPGKRADLLNSLNANGIVVGHEIDLRRKDGSTCSVLMDAKAVRDVKGKTVYYEGRVVDITGRKRAEEALRESEERHRVVVERTGQLVYDVDVAAGIVKRSGAIREISGYTPDEFQRGVDFWTGSIHPDDRALAVTSFRKAMQQCSHYDVEYRFRRKDGTYVFIEDRGVFLKNEEGRAYRMLGTMKNITRRKKLMNELKVSKEELEIKNTTLEEVNTALRVLLRQIEQDRKDQEERFVSNLRKLVLPYVDNIKKGRLDARQKSFISIIEANLNEIVSPLLQGLKQFNLNPRQVRIASLIKDGKTTKEIADIMGVAPCSIDTHRNIMRRKLGLNNTKTSLQTYLQSIMQT
jgi:PAS domain S-box-containing protein